VEACQFSKPPKVQGTGIGWQNNVYCFLGCWRCTANWLYASQGGSYRGLPQWLTSFTNFMLQLNRSAEKSWPRYRYSCIKCTCSQVTCCTSRYLNAGLKKCAIHHILLIWHWWLASVTKLKETSPWSEICERWGAQVCDRQVVNRTVRTVLFYRYIETPISI